MTTKKLDTIEMTRRIRDALYEEIKDKTLSERLAFYREQARAVHRRLGIEEPTQPPMAPDSESPPIVSDKGHRHHES
jgi:hypothetical protein